MDYTLQEAIKKTGIPTVAFVELQVVAGLLNDKRITTEQVRKLAHEGRLSPVTVTLLRAGGRLPEPLPLTSADLTVKQSVDQLARKKG